ISYIRSRAFAAHSAKLAALPGTSPKPGRDQSVPLTHALSPATLAVPHASLATLTPARAVSIASGRAACLPGAGRPGQPLRRRAWPGGGLGAGSAGGGRGHV